ncbi:MAG: hypothetical protein KGK33_08170 [Hyphomicrobiales bacterium]|nr:hypothetical protein [Hyphomicrobiales bacterium]MDE1972261.1 hypothetical protein [Hyphomicrobiales bacterium]MDE2284573.1 hypothetical protein [Hyphomicrobiales bacterium]
MRALFAGLAAILFTALSVHCAAAMTMVPPVHGTLIQQVVSICGGHGCVAVHTKRIIRHQKPGNKVPHHI